MSYRRVVTFLFVATSTISAQRGATAPAEVVHAQRLKQLGDSLTPGAYRERVNAIPTLVHVSVEVNRCPHGDCP